MKRLLLCLMAAATLLPAATAKEAWTPDAGGGRYRNPVLHADYSDPDAVRGSDGYFYLTASSFASTPGLPVLRSADLVNWEIIGYAIDALEPRAFYDAEPRHGKGVWAPSIREHDGRYYIYWGDPDFGIFMVSAADPAGPWSEPVLVIAGRGMIDPTPLWDDDGRLYLVHAWAASRSGFNSVLTIFELSADGTRPISEPVLVVDGNDGVNHTIEGPKLYKRNGWYYIFAPAGGVEQGWQLAMRSRNIYGPYETRRVMEQGDSPVNGPHQGAWVDDAEGQSWFLHFQDKGPYGRVVHLQPMRWADDWPVIGDDPDGDGIGNPVLSWRKPAASHASAVTQPATSDHFDSAQPGLQWEWSGNPGLDHGFPSAMGFYRLYGYRQPEGYRNMWSIPNLMLQKFPAPEFKVTARVRISAKAAADGAVSGIVVMGRDYSTLGLRKEADGFVLVRATCTDAEDGTSEVTQDIATIAPTRTYAAGLHPNYECDIWLRVSVDKNAMCRFSYSTDERRWHNAGEPFAARAGKWIGAKVGLYSTAPAGTDRGWMDIDSFTVEK
ncbi:MAG: glycoside hydrolase 43 family protein [Muribaculaceae bacterium]|nr:glycoside hydrolase 43 family protein [Muribaculaceae bacterium]